MHAHVLHTATYLDILFEGRNKAYGSYELRHQYPARLKRALGAVFIATLLLSCYSVIADWLAPHRVLVTRPIPPVVLTPLPPAPAPKVVAPARPPLPAAATPQAVVPSFRLVQDDSVRIDAPLPTPEPVSSTSASATTTGGGVPGGISGGVPGGVPGGRTAASSLAGTSEPPGEPFVVVEQPPVPPFDVSAYLSDRIRYPDAAREAGIEGRVVLKFVVNEDGDISDVQVVKSVDAQLDAEAVRVVTVMPKWKPGKQNGRPVKVYFNLPVSFRLE